MSNRCATSIRPAHTTIGIADIDEAMIAIQEEADAAAVSLMEHLVAPPYGVDTFGIFDRVAGRTSMALFRRPDLRWIALAARETLPHRELAVRLAYRALQDAGAIDDTQPQFTRGILWSRASLESLFVTEPYVLPKVIETRVNALRELHARIDDVGDALRYVQARLRGDA